MLAAGPAFAHFLWIKTIDDGGKPQAFMFFGESPTDEAYHFPEKMAKVKLWSRAADGKRTEISTKPLDTDDRVGLVGAIGDEKAVALETSQQYGVYGDSLLLYHAKHVRGSSPKELNSAKTSKELQLEIVPNIEGDDAKFTVLWEGKPLAGAAVTINAGEGEPIEKKTGDDGSVSIKLANKGLVGVLANHTEKDKSGELDGKSYKGVMHYASLTFDRGAKDGSTKKKQSTAQAEPSDTAAASILSPLPEPLASFGAVVADGWLYVYGGHTGGEHEHSAANLSQRFLRIRLDGASAWEELPMQTPLQGLPLVAHGGKVYRIGGLEIRNPTTDDEEDLHSTSEFAEFDPASEKWTVLAPLPAARSSHNAVVIGDKLYVVGGWRLEGKSPGEWQPDALVYDFSKPQAGWQKLPETPFKRRALAVGQSNGQVFAIGGMDETSKTSMRVDLFDPQTNAWSQGPELPGAGMDGFGVSAWNLDGKLYVSGWGGTLYRLNDSGSAWEEAGRMTTGRFFHQLVPAPHGGLMAVGGASREGHLATIERVDMPSVQVVNKGSNKPPL